VEQSLQEARPLSLLSGEVLLKLVAHGHQLVDLGDDATLLDEPGQWNCKAAQACEGHSLLAGTRGAGCHHWRPRHTSKAAHGGTSDTRSEWGVRGIVSVERLDKTHGQQRAPHQQSIIQVLGQVTDSRYSGTASSPAPTSIS
jgi:hypothetical protein